MTTSNALSNAFHPTFEDGEHAFNVIGVDITANVFLKECQIASCEAKFLPIERCMRNSSIINLASFATLFTNTFLRVMSCIKLRFQSVFCLQ